MLGADCSGRFLPVPYVQILVQTPQRNQVQGVGTNSFKSSTACVN